MAKGRIPLKPWLRKGTGQYYMTLDGKQIPLGRDKGKAKIEFHERLAAHERLDKAASEYTVDDVYAMWIAASRKDIKAPTLEKYTLFGESFRQKYGALRIRSLKPFHVIEWGTAKEWNSSTLHLAYSAIKRMILWGLKAGYYDVDPLRMLERPEMLRRKPISSKDADAIIRHAAPAYKAAFTVLRQTGMRPGELCSMLAENVDFLNHKVLVEGKTKVRPVWFAGECEAILKSIVAERPSGPVFWDGPDRITVWRLQHAALRIRRRFNLPDHITPHCFRGLFVSEAIARGLTPEQSSLLVGHRNIATTMKYYATTSDAAMHALVSRATERPSSSGSAGHTPQGPPSGT